MIYRRFAIYFLPEDRSFARAGATWLGWDVQAGTTVAQPDIPGLSDVTAGPRKYGFHATLKPPFRLADGQSSDALQKAVGALAARLGPVSCDGLQVTALGRFLALTIAGHTAGVDRVAASCVADLDQFRAQPSDSELAQRRRPTLTAAQQALLERWGYPHVMESFRFHMTLTERLPKADIAHWQNAALGHFVPLHAPFVLSSLALVGERGVDDRFELIRRFDLAGSV